jgi:ABC-type nitrate/sulfonate/bicarbonate transport system substrate-binding protein
VNNGTPRPITVHEHMIEHHFDLVVRFLEQTLRAADWASTNLPRTASTYWRRKPWPESRRWRRLSQRFPSLAASRSVRRSHRDAAKIQANFLWYHGFLTNRRRCRRWVDARAPGAVLAAPGRVADASRSLN